MAPTKLRHKILLILAGILACAVLLEIILRLGGGLFFLVQRHQNQTGLETNGDVRILCLGESTTALGGAHAYPYQLEHILNTSQDKIKFSVINKGIPSITTSHIVAHLEKYLDEYHPQIVTVMMGINDGATLKDVYEARHAPGMPLLKNFRVYKFFKLLKAHLSEIRSEIGIRNAEKKLKEIKRQIDRHPSSKNYAKLAGFYRVLVKLEEEEEALLKAIELNPKNYEALGYLGVNLRRQGEHQKAAGFFERAVENSPDEGDFKLMVTTLLAEAYTLSGQYKEAEAVHRKAMAEIPGYVNGYYFIGDLYRKQGRCDEALQYFRQQLDINPGSVLTYGKMAFCLRKKGLNDTAERLLRQGLKLNPKTVIIYAELGSQLLAEKKYAEAEKIFKKAMTLKKDQFEGIDINLADDLLASYKGQGRTAEAAKLQKLIDAYNDHYNFVTYTNYQKLRNILKQRNIILVVVQYPMRSVGPLKKILNGSGDYILVDNEKSFQEAVQDKGYDALFYDRFAGDFGHFTKAGHRLIAQNIARRILDIFQ